MDQVIHREKSLLQKISKVMAMLSFFVAIAGMLVLMFIGSELDEVYRASAGAITFFCFTVGLVLKTMADTNLPILKIPQQEKK